MPEKTLLSENIPLRPYNTFGIQAVARYFAAFSGTEELGALLEFGASRGFPLTPALVKTPLSVSSPRVAVRDTRLLVLGGGSNILLTADFDGLVLLNQVTGIDLVHEDAEYVYVKAGAGESWHSFVLHCLQNSWAGVENLSLIPGSVGAGPMQNIGAYGVEIRDTFYELEAYHIGERKVYTFTLNDCAFGYRESVFKREYRGQFVILNVTFCLRKKPVFHTSYGAIGEELEKMGVRELSIQAISQAVIHIRSSKLPDPQQIGNAGSFFKNPEVDAETFSRLKAAFPGIVGYPLAPSSAVLPSIADPGSVDGANSSPGIPDRVKLAAGWLIEQCGWKGVRRGDAGCHARQALVLVNYGNASGREIYDLSTEILASVKDRFGVMLEREVNII